MEKLILTEIESRRRKGRRKERESLPLLLSTAPPYFTISLLEVTSLGYLRKDGERGPQEGISGHDTKCRGGVQGSSSERVSDKGTEGHHGGEGEVDSDERCLHQLIATDIRKILGGGREGGEGREGRRGRRERREMTEEGREERREGVEEKLREGE